MIGAGARGQEKPNRVNTRTQSQNSYKRKLANPLHYQGLALVFAALRGGGGCFPPARASGGDYAPN